MYPDMPEVSEPDSFFFLFVFFSLPGNALLRPCLRAPQPDNPNRVGLALITYGYLYCHRTFSLLLSLSHLLSLLLFWPFFLPLFFFAEQTSDCNLCSGMSALSYPAFNQPLTTIHSRPIRVPSPFHTRGFLLPSSFLFNLFPFFLRACIKPPKHHIMLHYFFFPLSLCFLSAC